MASTGLNSSVRAADAAASRAEFVVALTSYNDVRTIAAVSRAIRAAFTTYFGSSAARILLADAGSTDGTREAAREAAGADRLVYVESAASSGFGDVPYHGHPNRAGALRAILQTAQRMEVKACAVLDAGLGHVEPEWVNRLIAPVLTSEFDYVSPYYLRRVNEGAITRGIVYPMFRALYGVSLRQPAAGEFGCSARVIDQYLDQDFWEAEQASAGIDLWLAAAAATGGFRTAEAVLGIRTSAPGEVAPELSTTLAEVVGALFADLEHRVDVWQRTRGSVPVPTIGTTPVLPVETAPVNVEGLVDSFRLGYRELREIWTWVLPARTLVELRKLTETPTDRLRFEDRLWAGIIYDFALGYGLRVLPRDHLLRSLTPLYSGWLASFALEMQQATLAEIEARVDRLCLGFEAEKRHLIARWRWPERLR